MSRISLNSMADMVIGQVQSGLKSVNNHGLSKSMVKDEIIQVRGRMILEGILKGMIDPNQLMQEFIIEKFFSHDESKVSNRKAIYAPIPESLFLPNVNTVEFIGSTDGYESFKVVTGTSNQHVSHDRFTSKAPTAWLNKDKIVIYNANPTRLLMRYVMNDPTEIRKFGKKFSDDDPFPVCTAFADMIIGKIVNDYFRYFRMSNPQPNTQVEINQAPQA